ncbi:DUF1302 domain-containing protein [Roseateles violae]|uniref:DUF1302 domain-containing protein n=1 Tax=Roseateles violae TaxID=3058042 RepID=A0ABT8DZF6_9BURK|nr:DUF1302 domain-containing protein [Pelomonas sp. PFR6]MDN3922947.1 DUF1302 domain-containing protein [Pelomonas sp. PFR6]
MSHKSLPLSLRLSPLALALLACSAGAFEIETGNQDLSVRFDNTVRLNYAQRVESRDSKIGNSPIADEGTYSFDRGDAVAERIDLLTELDIVYKKRFGARFSGTAWRDFAYDGNSRRNPAASPLYTPSYVGQKYSKYVNRFYQGGSGEVMDAFVFGGVDIGDVPVQAKLGRHTVYWGESLLLGGNMHGIAYSQNPLDLQKGFATPGTEAKELFRPLNQFSVQAQVTDTLSLAAQYMLEWESFRYPEGGTYLGPVDFAFNGPNGQINAQLGFIANGGEVAPKQRGEWGLAARWSPEWLDGTLGFYVRDYADKMPQALITNPVPGKGVYNLIYADDIMLYGVSLAKNIGGVSVGTELSFRRNTPLSTQTLGIAPGLPAQGQTKGARGDTTHFLINMLGVIAKTPIFDTASWAAEVTWSEYTKVRSGANLFNAIGAGYAAACNAPGVDKWNGCTTKSYTGLGLGFTPTWFQVLPGVDLSAPITASVGLRGNAATTFGGNEEMGNYSLGLGADVFQKYRFDLKYIDYFGRTKDNGTAVTAQNGFTTLLKDRGFVSLTFKTTF